MIGLLGFWLGRGAPGLPFRVQWTGFRSTAPIDEDDFAVPYRKIERDLN